MAQWQDEPNVKNICTQSVWQPKTEALKGLCRADEWWMKRGEFFFLVVDPPSKKISELWLNLLVSTIMQHRNTAKTSDHFAFLLTCRTECLQQKCPIHPEIFNYTAVLFQNPGRLLNFFCMFQTLIIVHTIITLLDTKLAITQGWQEAMGESWFK